jgi:hypothetical protein
MITANKFFVSLLLADPIASTAMRSGGRSRQQPSIVELTQLPCQFLSRASRAPTTATAAATSRTARRSMPSPAPAASKHAQAPAAQGGQVRCSASPTATFPYELGFWLRGDGIAGRVTLAQRLRRRPAHRPDAGLRRSISSPASTSIPAHLNPDARLQAGGQLTKRGTIPSSRACRP